MGFWRENDRDCERCAELEQQIETMAGYHQAEHQELAKWRNFEAMMTRLSHSGWVSIAYDLSALQQRREAGAQFVAQVESHRLDAWQEQQRQQRIANAGTRARFYVQPTNEPWTFG